MTSITARPARFGRAPLWRAAALAAGLCAFAAAGWLPGVSGTGGGAVWDLSDTPLALPLVLLALLGGAAALGALPFAGRPTLRSPLGLGVLVAAWSSPRMSFAHLVVAVAISMLMVVAAASPVEERGRARPRPALVILPGGVAGPYSRPSAREISRAVKSTSGITLA